MHLPRIRLSRAEQNRAVRILSPEKRPCAGRHSHNHAMSMTMTMTMTRKDERKGKKRLLLPSLSNALRPLETPWLGISVSIPVELGRSKNGRRWEWLCTVCTYGQTDSYISMRSERLTKDCISDEFDMHQENASCLRARQE